MPPTPRNARSWYNCCSCPSPPRPRRGSAWTLFPTAFPGLSSRTGRRSSPTLPIVQAPISPGSSPGTRWESSWRAAIDPEGAFERFGDEGTAVSQEDVLELQGDQAERSGACDLLQDAETQAASGLSQELG